MREERLRIKPIGEHPRISALASICFDNEDKTLKDLDALKREAGTMAMKHCLNHKDIISGLFHICGKLHALCVEDAGKSPYPAELHIRKRNVGVSYIPDWYPFLFLYRNRAKMTWVNVKPGHVTPEYEYVRYYNDRDELDVLDEVWEVWKETEVCLPTNS